MNQLLGNLNRKGARTREFFFHLAMKFETTRIVLELFGTRATSLTPSSPRMALPYSGGRECANYKEQNLTEP